MFQGTLSLLARSLRLDARLRRAHAFRFVSIGIAFWLLVAAHINTAGVGAPGLLFFSLICNLCLGLISVAAIGFFSSAITEEKEAGTLHLLLLANVPPVAILVGKSTTRLVTALLLSAGIFPFVLLALALGGVTVHQIVCGFVALAAYLVFVANLGLFSSVVSRTTGRASIMTTAILLFLLTSPILLPQLSTSLLKLRWVTPGGSIVQFVNSSADQLSRVSPFVQLPRILETGFAESILSRQVIVQIGAGLALFLVAWGVFRKSCEYLKEDQPGRRGVVRFRASRTRWMRFFASRPWPQALVWKDFQFLTGGLFGLLIRGVAIPVSAALLYFAGDLSIVAMGISFVDSAWFCLAAFVVGEALLIATRIFHSEYRWGTLCTLVMLPRSTLYLCYTKLAGCLLGLAPVIVWSLVFWWVLPATNASHDRHFVESLVLWGCLLLVLAHTTAILSLTLKWGALPLAIMLLLILSSCASPFVAMASNLTQTVSGEEETTVIPVLYLTFLLCAVFQVAIGWRFHRAAAE